MRHPPTAPANIWLLPPYGGPAHHPVDARFVLALDARPALPPAERARVRLMVQHTMYAADLSRNDVRHLRDWLEQVERVMDETAARRRDAPG